MDRNGQGVIHLAGQLRSLSARRAWIEIVRRCGWYHGHILSLSARRAWIEIGQLGGQRQPPAVALRKESVDRNRRDVPALYDQLVVALRKESVDRNLLGNLGAVVGLVALRKESVDRNIHETFKITGSSGRSPQGERG